MGPVVTILEVVLGILTFDSEIGVVLVFIAVTVRVVGAVFGKVTSESCVLTCLTMGTIGVEKKHRRPH